MAIQNIDQVLKCCFSYGMPANFMITLYCMLKGFFPPVQLELPFEYDDQETCEQLSLYGLDRPEAA